MAEGFERPIRKYGKQLPRKICMSIFNITSAVREAFDVTGNSHRIRCPGCDAVLAEYISGVYLRRCYRCWGKVLILSLPGVQATTMMTCIHDDEAFRVSCPNCTAPLGEYMVGVYKTVCHYCKWSGIITRAASSLVQSHHTLRKPSRDVGWQPGKSPGRTRARD